MSESFSFLSDNEAEIEFEQDQDQEAEQNATNEVEQENTVEGPIVVLFGSVTIGSGERCYAGNRSRHRPRPIPSPGGSRRQRTGGRLGFRRHRIRRFRCTVRLKHSFQSTPLPAGPLFCRGGPAGRASLARWCRPSRGPGKLSGSDEGMGKRSDGRYIRWPVPAGASPALLGRVSGMSQPQGRPGRAAPVAPRAGEGRAPSPASVAGGCRTPGL